MHRNKLEEMLFKVTRVVAATLIAALKRRTRNR